MECGVGSRHQSGVSTHQPGDQPLDIRQTESSGSKPFKQMFPLGTHLRAGPTALTWRHRGDRVISILLFRKGEENILKNVFYKPAFAIVYVNR